jgi:hypothetical protein
VGCCYAAGAFSLGSGSGKQASQWGGLFLGSVPRTRWWANVEFSLESVLGLLHGNDIYIRSSVFFGVCSGAVVDYDEIFYIYKGEWE